MFELDCGRSRTRIYLRSWYIGEDILVNIYNTNAHIGAIALAEYSKKERRTSVSVITRLGHKDDVIARRGAYNITKFTGKTSCVIAGIHLDNIKKREVSKIVQNCDKVINDLISKVTRLASGSDLET